MLVGRRVEFRVVGGRTPEQTKREGETRQVDLNTTKRELMRTTDSRIQRQRFSSQDQRNLLVGRTRRG